MAFKGDLCAANGTYQKDGEEKTSWLKCGAVFEKDGKLSVRLEAMPMHRNENGEVWFSVFEPRRKAQSNEPSW